MITILIPIFISVLVAVASAAAVRAVQDKGHVPVFLVGIEFLYLRQHAAVEQAGTDNEQGDVCQFVDDGGIGYDLHRRAVDEDVVVLLAKVAYQLFQTLCEQEFRRVGRYHAYRDNI